MNVITTITGTTARLTPRGEVDFPTLPSLHTAVDRLPAHGIDLLWDLEHLSFTDTAGLRMFFGPAPQDSRPHKTVVTNLRDQPLRLLFIAAGLFPAAYDLTRLIPDTPAGLTDNRS